MLSENGTPNFDPQEITVTEYLTDPTWFHFEVLAALRADPASEELYAGLRALYRETRTTQMWLTIDA